MEFNHICFIFIITIAHFSISYSTGEVNSLESVPALEHSMYTNVNGYACVRLLNLSAEIGCANPGRQKVVAPVVRLKNIDKLTQSSTLLISEDEMQTFFNSVSNDQNLAKNVAGVLIEPSTESAKQEGGFSPAEKFPQAEFAPYKNINYEWNPPGSNIMWKKYNFPVFLLSQDSTILLREIAAKNEKRKNAYTFDVAEFDLVMQTTKVGTHDSESCLEQQSCLPLGGYSVLSSLPPLNAILNKPKPIIMAVASMDSASFFRDKSPGADSPLSGMISLVAAVDALSHVDGIDELDRQFVFLVFTGEAWGYLGSRRFLAELDMNSDVVHGINSKWIEQVIEVGSTGKAFNREMNSYFIHSAGALSASDKTFDAFQSAHESLGSSSKISMASKSNPGIPPSSMMSFLRKNSSISGFILEDFDTSFTNKFYHSHLDDISNINSSAVATAASLVARTLYILASGDNTSNKKALSSINVNSSLVEELIRCLLTCDPGLSCGLVKDYIVPTGNCPKHYTGVLVGEPSSKPYLEYVSDVSRFVWNFLAERTSTPKQNTNSSCSHGCSNGEVCIRSEKNGNATCVVSTTRYVPAYSTRLKFESGLWKVLPQNASDIMGMVDPVWTESFWDTIQLRVYTVQSETYDNLILVAGIAITLLAYIATLITRTAVAKALKHD